MTKSFEKQILKGISVNSGVHASVRKLLELHGTSIMMVTVDSGAKQTQEDE